jgi:mannose-6-phosphate isomerase-like protein (cupin superfamily)
MKPRHFSFSRERFDDVCAHQGRGTVSTTRVVSSSQQSAFEFIDLTEMPPGSSIGMHTHGNDEEAYVIVSGTGEMTVDGHTFQVGAGDVIVNAAGGTHGLVNTGDVPLRMVVLDALRR